MATITSKPPQIILSGNPAWFIITGSAPGKVIMATITTGADIVAIETSTTDNSSKASFQLQEYFDDNINPVFETISEVGPIALAMDGPNPFSKYFTINFQEINGGSQSTSHYVVKGTLTLRSQSVTHIGTLYHCFSEYLNASKNFLSYRPSKIFVRYPNQPERLYFLVYKPDLASSVTIAAERTHADGTTSSWNAATISTSLGTVYEIKTSYAALLSSFAIDPENPVISYAIVLKTGSTEISKKITYVVDFSPENKLSTFLFRNPAGGYDTFVASGYPSHEASVDNQLFSVMPYMDKTYPYLSKPNNNPIINKVNSGYVSKQNILWLIDLFASDMAYHVLPSPENPSTLIPVPIVFPKNSFSFQLHPGKLISIDFQFMYNIPRKAELAI